MVRSHEKVESERQQRKYRRWIAGCPEEITSGHRFAIGPKIALVYGDLTDEAERSERALVEYLLRFANGQEARVEARRYIESPSVIQDPPDPATLLKSAGSDPADPRLTRMIELMGRTFSDWREATPSAQQERSEVVQMLSNASIQQRRGRLCEFLSEVVKNRGKAAAEFHLSDAQLDQIKSVSVLLRGKGTVEIVQKVVLEDPDSFELFARSLLLKTRSQDGKIQKDQAGEVGAKDLCKCSLDGCGTFFLKKSTGKQGRPRSHYCTQAHGDKAHKRTEARRQSDKSRRKIAVRRLQTSGYGPASAKRLIAKMFDEHPGATAAELAAFARNTTVPEKNHK